MKIISCEIPEMLKLKKLNHIYLLIAEGIFLNLIGMKFLKKRIGAVHFVQENESFSTFGVLRGLHFQKPPMSQGKLVRVIKGEVLDVAVGIFA